jgi:hypothetical protein
MLNSQSPAKQKDDQSSVFLQVRLVGCGGKEQSCQAQGKIKS